VLATTATANNRVVNDIITQLGQTSTCRGTISQKSGLQNIQLSSQAARLAWLAEHLPNLPSSGMSTPDSSRCRAGCYSKGYDSLRQQETEVRLALEERLLNNQIKALVATTALGMGFDKPDLGFVIHYQRPGSCPLLSAGGTSGRAVEQAYGILLSGDGSRNHKLFHPVCIPA